MQTVEKSTTKTLEQPLIIAGKKFTSRLMTGTGKYSTIKTMQQSIEASRCEIITVAVRRVQTLATWPLYSCVKVLTLFSV